MKGQERGIRRAAIIVALVGALGPSSAVGQVDEMVGETVRVRLADDQQVQGAVLVWGPDLLELRGVEGATLQLEWGRVREVARYRLRRKTVRGLWIGALAGGVVAGVHAGVTWEPCTAMCFGPSDRGGTIALAAVLGASAGALVGTAVGAFIKSPSWEPIAVPSLSTSPSATSAAAIRLGLRWTLH